MEKSRLIKKQISISCQFQLSEVLKTVLRHQRGQMNFTNENKNNWEMIFKFWIKQSNGFHFHFYRLISVILIAAWPVKYNFFSAQFVIVRPFRFSFNHNLSICSNACGLLRLPYLFMYRLFTPPKNVWAFQFPANLRMLAIMIK